MFNNQKIKTTYELYIREYGYIGFDEFVDGEYEYFQKSLCKRNKVKCNSNIEPVNKYNSNGYCEYKGIFNGMVITPANELDRQTLDRWTKEESLTEQWNKLR